jgi:hypothetical protein
VAVDLEAKSDQELENIVANHRRLKKYGATLFLAALVLLERRKSGGFDIEETVRIIRRYAVDRKFLSYKDIADASGLEWSRVHWTVGPHLVNVCEFAHGKGWPLLSAIVVNIDKVDTGEMKATNLKGFLEAVEIVGRDIGMDLTRFVHSEQRRVFDWARSEVAT